MQEKFDKFINDQPGKILEKVFWVKVELIDGAGEMINGRTFILEPSLIPYNITDNQKELLAKGKHLDNSPCGKVR